MARQAARTIPCQMGDKATRRAKRLALGESTGRINVLPAAGRVTPDRGSCRNQPVAHIVADGAR
jgi:hypothetical protein